MLGQLWWNVSGLSRRGIRLRHAYLCRPPRHRLARRPRVRLLEDRTLLSALPLIGGPPLAPLAVSLAGSTLATATPISPVGSVQSILAPPGKGVPFSGAFFSFRLTEAGQLTAQVAGQLTAQVPQSFFLCLFNSAGILLSQYAVVSQIGTPPHPVVVLPSPLLPATASGTVYYLEVQGLQSNGIENSGPFNLDLYFQPSKVPTVPLPPGTLPSAEAVGDFNGDGHTDIAFADQTNNTVVIELGKGDGTFTTGQAIRVGGAPDALIAGYFNHDHHLDLAVANWVDNTVTVLLGNGDGTFTVGQTIRVGFGPDALVSGFFDAGRNLDLAVANELDGTVTILRGNGDGTFEPLPSIAVGGFPRALTVGDFNGDGRADLVVVDPFNSAVTVLLGQGAGGFTPLPAVALSQGIDTVVAADFNADGHLDLAVADQTHGDIEVLLGRGDGTFAAPITTPPQVSHHGDLLVVGDFDSANAKDDPHLDLGESDARNGTLTVLQGNGDGTFTALTPVPVSPGAVAAADFNGNGQADICIANSLAEIVTVLLGNGQGGFATSQVLAPRAANQGQLEIGLDDFNGDGNNDLAVASQADNTLTVLLGDGTGNFDQGQVLSLPTMPTAVTADYFSGSTAPVDLVVAYVNGTIQMFLGQGNGTFIPGKFYAAGANPGALARGYFTNDGNLDLAVLDEGDGTHDGTVSLLLGNGDGTFRIGEPVTVGHLPDVMASPDFNGDGKTDLAVVNAGDHTLMTLVCNGDGTFRLGSLVQLNQNTHPGLAPGNFTQPGVSNHVDLAVADQDGGQVEILRGDGKGGFKFLESIRVGLEPRALAAGHYQGKSPLDDFAVVGTTGQPGLAELVEFLPNQNGVYQPTAPVTFFVAGTPDLLRSRPLIAGDVKHQSLVLGTTGGDLRVFIPQTSGNGPPTIVQQVLSVQPLGTSVHALSAHNEGGEPSQTGSGFFEVMVSPATAPFIIFNIIVGPPVLFMAGAPLVVAAEVGFVPALPTLSSAGLVAESAAASTSVGTDDVVNQLDRAAPVAPPQVLLPGAAELPGLPDMTGVVEGLIVPDTTPLPGHADHVGPRRRNRADEAMAKGTGEGSGPHFLIIGLPDVPMPSRPKAPAPAKPGQPAPRRRPGFGGLPNDPGDDAQPSLLERAVAEHPLRLGVLAAGTVAGLYGLTVWFGARARAVSPEDDHPPPTSPGARADC
jgi:hypothetical protein